MQTLINTRIWALEPSFMEKMQPLVIARLNAGHDLSIFKHDYEAALATTKNQKYNKVFTRNMRVGMLPLFGSMSKYGDMCSYGTQDLIKMKDAMNADPDIDAIVMVTDSPGGSVLGIQEFGESLKNNPKPVVAFVDGDMASAAYWAGANSSHIMMNSQERTAAVGSIGTLYVHVNQSKLIADKVGEVKIIRAPQSVDKARINSIEPLTEDLEAGIVAELEDLTNYFIETVTNGRGAALKAGKENIFTGKMYKGKEAKKLGMIDSVGTINDAIDKAASLAKSGSFKSLKSSNSNNSQMFSLKNWLSGKSAAEGETMVVSAEELTQLRADMQEASQLNDTLTAENTQLKDEKTTLTASNAELAEQNAQLEEENASLQAQVDELEKQPDATSSKVSKEGDAAEQAEEATYVATDRSWNSKANKALGRQSA